ncbi:hypothetical protein [Roseofilum casamattae]|nr:hypothetical protein [Roseofilum casamattae]
MWRNSVSYTVGAIARCYYNLSYTIVFLPRNPYIFGESGETFCDR